jgi:hypothetical protein
VGYYLELARAAQPRPTNAGPVPIIAPKNGAEWKAESYDAEARFGQPHAKLFTFIGRKVRTPNGPGTLLQVFADRATVLLDSERDHVCVRFLPSEVIPVAPEEAYA